MSSKWVRAAGMLVAAVIAAACGGSSSTGTVSDIIVGSTLPLTGVLAGPGLDVKAGEQFGVDEVNAKGGINGHKLQLIVSDDGGDPAQGITVTNDLVTSQHAVVLLGTYGSAIALTESQTAEKLKVPNIVPFSGDPSMVTRGYKYLFNMFANGVEGVLGNDAFLQNALNPKSVAILYANTTAQINQAVASKANWEKQGVSVPVYESFDPNLGDFSGLAAKIKAANVDMVTFCGLQKPYIPFMVAMKQLKVSPKAIVSWTSIGTDANALKALGSTDEYVLGNLVEDNQAPMYQTFAAAFQAKTGKPVDDQSVGGYAAVQVLIKALQSASGTQPDQIRNALATVKADTVVGAISFGANGQATRVSPIVQVQSGQLVVLAPASAAKGTFKQFVPWDQR